MLRSKSIFLQITSRTFLSHIWWYCVAAFLRSACEEGVKLLASLGEDGSACISGKYITLFLPSTRLRPPVQLHNTS